MITETLETVWEQIKADQVYIDAILSSSFSKLTAKQKDNIKNWAIICADYHINKKKITIVECLSILSETFYKQPELVNPRKLITITGSDEFGIKFKYRVAHWKLADFLNNPNFKELKLQIRFN